MRYNKNLAAWQKECWKADPEAQMEKMRVEMLGETQRDEAAEGIGQKNAEREEAPGLSGAFRASGRQILGQAPQGSAHAGAFLFPPA